MLSDPTYSTDFLKSRIINVESSPKKRKWAESDALMQYQSKSVDLCVEENESSTVGTSFANEFSDHMAYAECSRSLAYSYQSGIPGFVIRDERNIYTNVTDNQTAQTDSKCNLGNREELSTPVTITTLDTSAVLNTSNYLYGQINETPTTLTTNNCYTFDLTDSPSGPLNNGIADGLDPLSTVSNQFDYTPAADAHSYVLPPQSGSPSQPATGESTLGPLASPTPCTPLFWFDDPGQSSTEPDYDATNCTTEAFHHAHLEINQADQHATAVRDNLARDTFEELYRTCEAETVGTEMDTLPYAHDTSTDTVLGSSGTQGDSAETRRDKLTGKFKQNLNEHSSATEKLCKVCSDRAVNHNFGQLTCESCKAFFRRNAHKFLPSLVDPMWNFTTPGGIDYVNALMSPSRPQYPAELTCTLKTGEHEITPTTRRECPACRLKKCFRVGMRPDLIQVRKKDGSKPRWLEKVPSAAIVHEKHLQATDSTSWTSILGNNSSVKNKSDNTGDHLFKQQSIKDCREEVCSTDSGSCISNETASLPMDSGISIFGGKRAKGKLSESTELMELGPINEVHFTDSTTDPSGAPAASTVALSDLAQATVGLYPTTDEIPSSNQLITTATVNTVNGPAVLVQPNATVGVSTLATGVQHSQTIGYEMPRSMDQPVSYQLNTACTPVTNKVDHLNGFEDFILLTNTPRLLVPTNVVTIETATTANQSPLNSSSLTPVHQTFGINLNTLDLSQSQSLGSQLHYTTYTKLSPDQSVQTISPNNVLIENAHPSIGQPLLTPIWNPSSNSTLTNGIIQMATAAEPVAQTLVPTMPKCVLATSIQPIQSITRTALVEASNQVSTAQFKPVTVTGATSFRLSVQSMPASVATVALTAVLPSATPLPTQMIHRTATIPTESSLLVPTARADSASALPPSTPTSIAASFVFTGASPQRALMSSTHNGIVTHSTTWSTTTSVATNANIVTQSGQTQIGLVETETSLSICQSENANYSKLEWTTNPALSRSSQQNTTGANNNTTTNSVIPLPESANLLATRCNLEDVNNAWTAMWREGKFSNPDKVELNIDTEAVSNLHWRLHLTNMWDDIFVRRIAVFAVALFGPLCNSHVDSFQSNKLASNTIVDQSQWPQESQFPNPAGTTQSALATDAGQPNMDQPFLTWSDLLWLAKHRFADCVPLLLISCLSRMDQFAGSEQIPLRPTQISVCQSADQPTTQQAPGDTKINTFTDTPMFYSKRQPCNSDHVCYDSTSGNMVARNNPETNGSSSLSQPSEYNAPVVIKFRCDPEGLVQLSLTNLSRCLAQLTVNLVHPGFTEPSKQLAYPILQYLDAYIAQFGNFLAHQPKLMGAFLALKLTDPHNEDCTNQTVATAGSKNNQLAMDNEHRERTRRLSHLHEHFVRIFSDAADSVALSCTGQSEMRNGTDTNTIHCSVETYAQEMAAANSRRAMLQDFLTWSRQFDTAWHEFQSDTWIEAQKIIQRVPPSTERMRISQGLNALLNDSTASELLKTKATEDSRDIVPSDDGSQGLMQLLLDAKAELCFQQQTA